MKRMQFAGTSSAIELSGRAHANSSHSAHPLGLCRGRGRGRRGVVAPCLAGRSRSQWQCGVARIQFLCAVAEKILNCAFWQGFSPRWWGLRKQYLAAKYRRNIT